MSRDGLYPQMSGINRTKLLGETGLAPKLKFNPEPVHDVT